LVCGEYYSSSSYCVWGHDHKNHAQECSQAVHSTCVQQHAKYHESFAYLINCFSQVRLTCFLLSITLRAVAELQLVNTCYQICFSLIVEHKFSQGGPGGHGPSKFLACLVVLRFEKRRPEQKYCCSPRVHFGFPKFLTPKNFGLARPLLWGKGKSWGHSSFLHKTFTFNCCGGWWKISPKRSSCMLGVHFCVSHFLKQNTVGNFLDFSIKHRKARCVAYRLISWPLKLVLHIPRKFRPYCI